MKNNTLLLIFVTLTILTSCTSKNRETQTYGYENVVAGDALPSSPPAIEVSEDVASSPSSSQGNTLGKIAAIVENKIIKSGNISIQTNDINTSKKNIDELLKKLNGYFEKEDLENNDQIIAYNLKIRVSADNFEKLISSIETGKDEIKSKSIQAKDVTETYVDIKTRLENKREYLKRYRELLAKAGTIKDVLSIEEQIRPLEEEIESKEGQLKYLNSQVAFSSLEINLYQKKDFVYKPEPKDNFFERVKNSLGNGWVALVELIIWTISIWPFIIAAFIAFWVARRVTKNRRNRQS